MGSIRIKGLAALVLVLAAIVSVEPAGAEDYQNVCVVNVATCPGSLEQDALCREAFGGIYYSVGCWEGFCPMGIWLQCAS
jgi:hypothetical protein